MELKKEQREVNAFLTMDATPEELELRVRHLETCKKALEFNMLTKRSTSLLIAHNVIDTFLNEIINNANGTRINKKRSLD